ncbi:MAG: serine/threonine protein kinase [Phycisphaerales bacterium]|nr:serine/threonine protein kinase [Phycisphaerales bacterium]
MRTHDEELLDEFERICGRCVLDSFAGYVRGRGVTSDASMAELIEVDGRALLATGREVELERYLEAVPNLGEMPVSLDAAIEFTLRSWTLRSSGGDEAVSRLVERYPAFSRSIRNSAALSGGLMSTIEAGRVCRDERVERALPCGFGPLLRDGVSRYELRRLLGRGAQGSVYLAVDRAMSDSGNEAVVAVKTLESRPTSEGDRWRRMDEATKARRIAHENVVRVLDRGWTDECEYIIYEYIAGGDLDSWTLARGKITARDAADVVRQLARGVHAAHAAGLVHRDLKPGNVLMAGPASGSRIEPKVTDFGVAELAGPDDGLADREGVPLGNIAFIAPEQYRREDGAWSAAVDVYALGGILFTMLTGRLPNGSTVAEIADTHDRAAGRAAAPRLDQSIAAGVDRSLESICRRAMAPAAVDRYRSADALAEDLDRWLEQRPIGWQRPGPARRLRLMSRRQPRLVAMTALACAAVIAGAAATMWTWAYASAWAAAESKARASAGEYLRNASDAVAKGRQTDIPGNWFPALNALESIVGPYLFDPRKAGKEPMTRKFYLAASAIRAAQVGNREDSLEALLWKDTLTFWLLRTGDYERADAILKQTQPSWDRILKRDDPWRNNHRAMRAAADAQRLLAITRAGRHLSGADEDVQGVMGSLRESERYLASEHYGDTMHRFVLGCLVQMYDRGALDDPKGLRWAESRVEEIRRNLLSEPSLPAELDTDFSSIRD